MPNSIAFARNYVSVIDEVYQRAGVSGVLNSGRRMVRAGHNAKEILIPKISVTGLGNYTRNVGYKTGSITYEFETKTLNAQPKMRNAFKEYELTGRSLKQIVCRICNATHASEKL